MEESTKLQPAASAVGSLNSKVSATGRKANGNDCFRKRCMLAISGIKVIWVLIGPKTILLWRKNLLIA